MSKILIHSGHETYIPVNAKYFWDTWENICNSYSHFATITNVSSNAVPSKCSAKANKTKTISQSGTGRWQIGSNGDA